MTRGHAAGLKDRRSERDTLDRLVNAVQGGQSQALVMRGDPGVGKTALLGYLAGPGVKECRVARAAGVESEMELAFAALHQFCSPVLDHLDRLPAPQRDALRTVFGLSAGPPPDRFLVGLAVLTLLAEVTEASGPCSTASTMPVAGPPGRDAGLRDRRLHTDSVGLVFAAREPDDALRGLPALEVHGLDTGDARALLSTVVRFILDEGVRDRIVAETHGNPLALLELPRDMTRPSWPAGSE